jgi:hypothetical protein
LNQAAAALESCQSWSLATPMVLIGDPPDGEGLILPIGQLGQWLEHLPAALDGFVHRRQQGMGVDEAFRLSRAEGGEDFAQAWERAQRGTPLVSHDDLASFASLCQRGFARHPRELLVVVRWPEQVSAFLIACQWVGPFNR